LGDRDVSSPSPHETSKRLTLSEIVERLLSRGSGERSSVSLTRNAKGETQIEVVVRTNDETETTIDQALAKAVDVYDQLRRQYPMLDGHTARPGSVAAPTERGDAK
jgi:hypothetical protein